MDDKTRTSPEQAAEEAPEKPGVVVESGGAVPEIATIADGSSAPSAGAVQQQQTTKIECSRGLADWLIMHNVSLAFTSYQTGQLFLVGVMPDRRISIHQRNFIRAMGLIAQPDRIYVAGLEAVWRMENILRRTEVANQYFDRLFRFSGLKQFRSKFPATRTEPIYVAYWPNVITPLVVWDIARVLG